MDVAELARAIVLGIIQGLTEFLPISSDGHLIIFRSAFGLSDDGLGFDVVLHLGTLLAVVVVFRADLVRLFHAGLEVLRERSIGDSPDRRLGLMLVVATVPGVIAGVLFEHLVSGPMRHPEYAGLFLLATGGLLLLAENVPAAQPKSIHSRSYAHALFVGSLQATAILPGLSRSGAAFAGGRMIGLSRQDAVRFSFLMMIPIVTGAVAYEGVGALLDLEWGWPRLTYVVGAVTAAVSGFFCVKFLLSFVQRYSLLPFAAYCVIVGSITLVLSGLS
ncbi:MAG: undecaprenyl-diphosphatase UppP [Dehalococcoidia bacterium]|nr:undecaprenyl-diphosphatase UppP [Dehalococcoidia bacterium]